jgi:hypothetical protein
VGDLEVGAHDDRRHAERGPGLALAIKTVARVRKEWRSLEEIL